MDYQLDRVCAVAFFFFFQAEDGIRDLTVTGVQTCALPISAASSAPPSVTTSSAWNFALSPYDAPASRTRRAWVVENTPSSQNTSTYSASVCSATAGSISSTTRSTYASVRPLNSGGTSCAPQKVGWTSTGWSSASRRAAASILSSSAVVSP